ncbi:Guanine nucleotide-binding protein subunit gamma 2 [Hirschfeldia incana]|nr:Guanine nucleotide-binding protein subunit gamma 2 [Hirschfeldia incana]
MEAAGSSNSSGQLSGRVVDTRGKHRIHAELKRLEQEARFLEEELEQLEKMDTASASCKEFLESVESKPDPLLPEYFYPLFSSFYLRDSFLLDYSF